MFDIFRFNLVTLDAKFIFFDEMITSSLTIGFDSLFKPRPIRRCRCCIGRVHSAQDRIGCCVCMYFFLHEGPKLNRDLEYYVTVQQENGDCHS